jgi:hypothetical protein
MNFPIDNDEHERALARALDAALARALPPPELPADFRAGLVAAVARESDHEALGAQTRLRLQREERAQLIEFEAGFVRLRRRTLGTLIGAAFAAGAAVAIAMPWARANFGPNAMLVLASIGTAVGLAIGLSSWLSRASARLTP